METATEPNKIAVAAPVYECLPRIDESFDEWIDRLVKLADKEKETSPNVKDRT